MNLNVYKIYLFHSKSKNKQQWSSFSFLCLTPFLSPPIIPQHQHQHFFYWCWLKISTDLFCSWFLKVPFCGHAAHLVRFCICFSDMLELKSHIHTSMWWQINTSNAFLAKQENSTCWRWEIPNCDSVGVSNSILLPLLTCSVTCASNSVWLRPSSFL